MNMRHILAGSVVLFLGACSTTSWVQSVRNSRASWIGSYTLPQVIEEIGSPTETQTGEDGQMLATWQWEEVVVPPAGPMPATPRPVPASSSSGIGLTVMPPSVADGITNGYAQGRWQAQANWYSTTGGKITYVRTIMFDQKGIAREYSITRQFATGIRHSVTLPEDAQRPGQPSATTGNASL